LRHGVDGGLRQGDQRSDNRDCARQNPTATRQITLYGNSSMLHRHAPTARPKVENTVADAGRWRGIAPHANVLDTLAIVYKHANRGRQLPDSVDVFHGLGRL
jgi:hypothetical protein